MRILERFIHPISKICRRESRNFSETAKVYANVPEVCSQETKKTCQTFLECGPCSKFKYMDLNCKIALITGGGCGIGYATANELLCQHVHKVIIADPNVENGIKAVEALEKAYGKDRACFVQLDIHKHDDFEDIFKSMHHKFGGIDILVNCTWPLKEYKWEHDIDANLKNIMRGTLVAMKWMPKERRSMKGGVVVNIAATCGLESESMAPIWTGTKHGVVGLSKALGYHEHYLKSGVRVICLCPGKDNSSDPLELKSPEQMKQYIQGVVRRPPSKVGSAVTYLLRYAPSGSIWVVENCALYKTNIPNRRMYSQIVDLL